MVERENDCKCVFVCVLCVFDVFSMHVVVSLGSQQWANLREREEPVRRSGERVRAGRGRDEQIGRQY